MITLLSSILAAVAALPALDAAGRWFRLARYRQGPAEPVELPRAYVVLVPARAEGERILGIARDLKRESGLLQGISLDVLVVLDGGDPDAEAALTAEGYEPLAQGGRGLRTLIKEPAGPTKGSALAFATVELERNAPGLLDIASHVLVFDADMRLPEGWFGALKVPEGTAAFQVPVRPAGNPPAGAPRVEAFSLAVATRVEDLVRDARGLPVRLRGKAMGFAPAAWRLGPACGTETMAEDSEATLRLLALGIRIRALAGPAAFDEPARAGEAMSNPRARWFAGHIGLLTTSGRDILRLALRRPWASFVLLADLYFRPRALLYPALLALLLVAAGLAAASPAGSAAPVVAGAVPAVALACEAAYLRRARRLIGFPEEVPRVTLRDLLAAAGMWLGAIGRALAAPGRWHRARPAPGGGRP